MCKLFGLVVLCSTVAFAADNAGQMPRAHQDWSAYRVDTQLLGWTPSFKEMAIIGIEAKREPDALLRGEAMLLVFHPGEMQPVLNMHVNVITGPSTSDVPPPMTGANDWLWSAGNKIQKTWSVRGTREPPGSHMKIVPLYNIAEVGKGQCVPWVGFMLTYKGVRKYQPHKKTELQAPCAALKHTDTETWWGRADVGVSLVRYDYGTEDNEKSMRIPVQALWKEARTVRVQLVYGPGVAKKTLDRVRKQLSAYAHVSVEKKTVKPEGSWGEGSVFVAYNEGFELLAQHFAQMLHAQQATLGVVEAGYDTKVVLWEP